MEDKPRVVRLLEGYTPSAPPVETVEKMVNSKDLNYEQKLKTLVHIMSPLIAIPQPEGVYTKYLIEDDIYRHQIQDWIMALTKKHLDL
jgi:hypothetical protein